jgi:hypothetical protein
MKKFALAVLVEAFLPACLGLGLVGCLVVKVGRAQWRELVG